MLSFVGKQEIEKSQRYLYMKFITEIIEVGSDKFSYDQSNVHLNNLAI